MDWLGGLQSFRLDGSRSARQMSYPYRFDAVTQSPSGDYTAIYERLGTKALILRGEDIVREIDRSYYFACNYDYPIVLFRLADGREAIIHCPEQYNRLEIEVLETGERLTARPENAPRGVDFFHSGLAIDPSGTWLMSAGWFWHPCYGSQIYRIETALNDPLSLDSAGQAAHGTVEVASAAFLDKDRLILAASPEAEDFGEDIQAFDLRPGMIGVYRLDTRCWQSTAPVEGTLGRLLVVDADHVFSLFEHPKLIHLASGKSWHNGRK